MSEFLRSGAIMLMAVVVLAAGVVVVFYGELQCGFTIAAHAAGTLEAPCRRPQVTPLKGGFPALSFGSCAASTWQTSPIPNFSKTRRRDSRDYLTPSVRLGVTGLSRAGKTVFITALVRNLVARRAPAVFRARRRAPHRPRLSRAAARRQRAALRLRGPSRLICCPRRRHGPRARERISELRVTIEYRSALRPEAGHRPFEAACRHRRLSRRMADRLAAARAGLPGIFHRSAGACRAPSRAEFAKPLLAFLAAPIRRPRRTSRSP